MANRNDPFSSFNFLVEIDGLGKAAFSECSGITMETDAIEYREGADVTHVRKLPGLAKYGNITFKRGFTKDTALWTWRKTVIDGKTAGRRYDEREEQRNCYRDAGNRCRAGGVRHGLIQGAKLHD